MRQLLAALIVAVASACATVPEQNPHEVRFGVVRIASDGTEEFDREATVLPKKLKDTGFRFGIEIPNRKRQPLEWYGIMKFPTEVRDVSGVLKQQGERALRTGTYKSDGLRIVDSFWFDEKDPIGKYTYELYMADALVYSVDFEVVPDGAQR